MSRQIHRYDPLKYVELSGTEWTPRHLHCLISKAFRKIVICYFSPVQREENEMYFYEGISNIHTRQCKQSTFFLNPLLSYNCGKTTDAQCIIAHTIALCENIAQTIQTNVKEIF